MLADAHSGYPVEEIATKSLNARGGNGSRRRATTRQQRRVVVRPYRASIPGASYSQAVGLGYIRWPFQGTWPFQGMAVSSHEIGQTEVRCTRSHDPEGLLSA